MVQEVGPYFPLPACHVHFVMLRVALQVRMFPDIHLVWTSSTVYL